MASIFIHVKHNGFCIQFCIRYEINCISIMVFLLHWFSTMHLNSQKFANLRVYKIYTYHCRIITNKWNKIPQASKTWFLWRAPNISMNNLQRLFPCNIPPFLISRLEHNNTLCMWKEKVWSSHVVYKCIVNAKCYTRQWNILSWTNHWDAHLL